MLSAFLLLSVAVAAPAPITPVATAPCDASAAQRTTAALSSSWTRWGVDERNSRFVGASDGALTAEELPRLKLKWAFALGETDNARSQPAVADGKLFVGSETGAVHALDPATGCTWWSYEVGSPVRSGIVVSPAEAGQPARVFLGSMGATVVALDASTGALAWKTKVEEHFAAVITGTPQLYRGVLYVPVSSFESVLPLQPAYSCCTFRGSIVAVDAATGRVQWKRYTIDEPAQPTTKSASGTQLKGPSGAAVWSTPTIDEKLDRLYIGTGNSYSDPASSRSDAIIALDRATGKVVWTRQFVSNDAYNSSCDVPPKGSCPKSDGPDSDFGQPPILVSLPGGARGLAIGAKSGIVRVIDPDREGAVVWERRLGPAGKLGGLHWGSAADSRNVYSAMGGQSLSAVGDSAAPGGYRLVPDPAKGGGLFALDLLTGTEQWHADPPRCSARPLCSPAQSAPVTAIAGAVLSGSLDGHLRAYSTADGRVIWDVDTAHDFTVVNEGRGRGGALDVSGPVIAGKMLFVTSGYAQFGGMPGNVLLAFSLDGR